MTSSNVNSSPLTSSQRDNNVIHADDNNILNSDKFRSGTRHPQRSSPNILKHDRAPPATTYVGIVTTPCPAPHCNNSSINDKGVDVAGGGVGGGVGGGAGGGLNSQRELTAYYTPSRRGGRRRWSTLEKYLILVSTLLLLACLTLVGLALSERLLHSGDRQDRVCTTTHCVLTAAKILDAIDVTVDPCEDFFQYACGAWNRNHQIPDDKTGYNTFENLHDQLQVVLKKLLKEPITEEDTRSTTQAKILYSSCINISTIEETGDAPLRDLIDELGGWPVLDPPHWRERALRGISETAPWRAEDKSWRLRAAESERFRSTTISTTKNATSRHGGTRSRGGTGSRGWKSLRRGREGMNRNSLSEWKVEILIGKLRAYNMAVLIESWVGADDKNSSKNVIQLDQAKLGMPSREYFLASTDGEAKAAYLRYMIAMACLLGAERETAVKEMTDVLLLEDQLANITVPQSDRHDTSLLYSKMTLRDLQEMAPEIDWLLYFNTFMPIELYEDEEVVVLCSQYLVGLAKVVNTTRPEVLANYVIWRLVLALSPELTETFLTERNEYRRVMTGVSRDTSRWQKCVDLVNERLGLALGQMFIREKFQKESKDDAVEMIRLIREAFVGMLEESNWMDDAAKAVAIEKAKAIQERIGYPEFILNATELDKVYQGLNFEEDKYFANILSVEIHDSMSELIKLREPILREKWEQNPAVVNAFYNPNTNDIVLPAGIWQPIFYSRDFPKSMNFGGIGVVIGHEITHGFDDKGRQYDKDGNLRQWWTNETIRAFRERGQCMIDQYSSYVLEPLGLNVDGRNTQGENIADNGGLKQSFRAYEKWVEKNGEELPMPGINLTHNQLFFLNYAQIWCGLVRDEEALQKLRTGVHSPGPIRVAGPLSNSYEFAKAYHCSEGTRMNPIKKCSVW